MNLIFYEALERAPLGAVVTVEFLGPLAVAVAGSRRRRDFGIVALAAGGIVLLARGGGSVSVTGLVLAALAGGCWAAYILISARVGARMSGTGPLAVAMVVAALASLPFGAASAAQAPGHALLQGLLVGVLSSTIPYALELEALRRLPARAFGVLMSLEPAVAALAGLALLGEHLAPRQWLGVGCVIAACALVTALGRRSPDRPARAAPAADAARSASGVHDCLD
jgi:inner membrane transporter RhtA